MANSPAFSIRNYITNSSNDEVIELDNEPMTVRREYTKFRSNGRGKVSPAPSTSYSNVVARARPTTTDWKPPRRRFQNVLLTLTSLLSLITFLLIVATLLGFVQPRNMRNSENCQCVSPPAAAETDALTNKENLPESNKDVENLRTEMAKIKQEMEARFEKINNARRDDDSEKLNEKFDELTTRLSNFTTGLSYISEKHGLLKQNLDNNLTQISMKMEKLAYNITKLTLFQKKVQENFRKTSTNYSNLLIYLQKDQNNTEKQILTVETKGNAQFDQLKKGMETNTTKIFKKLDKLSLDIKKFVNDTSKEILQTSNTNNMKLKQFQSKTERNLTAVSQSIDNLAENLRKLGKDTNIKFANNLNHINKFDQLQKEIETNATKVFKNLDRLSLDFNKFVNDTSKEILRTSTINNMKFQQFHSKTERNLTIVSQSIQNLAEDLQKLDNDTNVKFVNNLNYVNQLFVPSKLRGPRGYNGTRGSTGLPGPAGPRGPPTRINFENCRYSNASRSGTRSERQAETTAKDTQSQIVIPVSCKSSIQDGVVDLKPAKSITTGHGFQYDCICQNVRPRVDFTCTINYVRCNLN